MIGSNSSIKVLFIFTVIMLIVITWFGNAVRNAQFLELLKPDFHLLTIEPTLYQNCSGVEKIQQYAALAETFKDLNSRDDFVYLIGYEHYCKGQLDQALEEWWSLPGGQLILLTDAETYFYEEKYDLSVDLLNAIFISDNSWMWFLFGQNYEKLNQSDKALAAYLNGLDVNYHWKNEFQPYEAAYRVGALYRNGGEYEESKAILVDYLELLDEQQDRSVSSGYFMQNYPDRVQKNWVRNYNSLIGEVSFFLKQYDEAQGYLAQTQRMDPAFLEQKINLYLLTIQYAREEIKFDEFRNQLALIDPAQCGILQSTIRLHVSNADLVKFDELYSSICT